jgi:hypothetical protein
LILIKNKVGFKIYLVFLFGLFSIIYLSVFSKKIDKRVKGGLRNMDYGAVNNYSETLCNVITTIVQAQMQ